MEKFLANRIAVALADGGNNDRSGGISSQDVIGADIELALQLIGVKIRMVINAVLGGNSDVCIQDIVVVCKQVGTQKIGSSAERNDTVQYDDRERNAVRLPCQNRFGKGWRVDIRTAVFMLGAGDGGGLGAGDGASIGAGLGPGLGVRDGD